MPNMQTGTQKMIQAKERYEQETKDMSLEEKLKWVKERIFWIAVDNYIKDWDSYHVYCELEHELTAQLKEQNHE